MTHAPSQATNGNNGNGRVVTPQWGLSIALVAAIIGGVVSNLLMMSSLSERASVVEATLKVVGDDVTEIKSAVQQLTSAMQGELRDLRTMDSNMRERLTRLEVEMAQLRVSGEKK